MLTQKELKKVLRYDSKTGIFTWKVSLSSNVYVGSEAGTTSGKGYRRIVINKIGYKAHRLAWLYVYGYFPENDIDHKDRIKDHNWIKNLREASKQCNNRNAGKRKDNTSGVKGISWSKGMNKWTSQIGVDRKVISLGFYEDFLEAVCHRLAAEQCVDWSGCDSSSPAYQYVKENITC